MRCPSLRLGPVVLLAVVFLPAVEGLCAAGQFDSGGCKDCPASELPEGATWKAHTAEDNGECVWECSSEYFRSGSMCTPAASCGTTCPDGQYRGPCNASETGRCTSCTNKPGDDLQSRYLGMGDPFNADNCPWECQSGYTGASCTRICANTAEFLTSSGECVACNTSLCDIGLYEAVDCAAASDRICKPCTNAPPRAQYTNASVQNDCPWKCLDNRGRFQNRCVDRGNIFQRVHVDRQQGGVASVDLFTGLIPEFKVAVVEAFNRRSGASDIFTLELSDVIVNDTCASISQECFTEPTRRALGTEMPMWSRSGRRAAEKGDVTVSVIVWEAAGMAPENFSAVFFNESGFWDLASELLTNSSGIRFKILPPWEHQVYLENLARAAAEEEGGSDLIMIILIAGGSGGAALACFCLYGELRGRLEAQERRRAVAKTADNEALEKRKEHERREQEELKRLAEETEARRKDRRRRRLELGVDNVSVSTESGGGSDDEDKSSKMETLSSSVPDTIENAPKVYTLKSKKSGPTPKNKSVLTAKFMGAPLFRVPPDMSVSPPMKMLRAGAAKRSRHGSSERLEPTTEQAMAQWAAEGSAPTSAQAEVVQGDQHEGVDRGPLGWFRLHELGKPNRDGVADASDGNHMAPVHGLLSNLWAILWKSSHHPKHAAGALEAKGTGAGGGSKQGAESSDDWVSELESQGRGDPSVSTAGESYAQQSTAVSVDRRDGML